MNLNDTAHEIWAMAQEPQAIEDSVAAIEEKVRSVLEESKKLQDSRSAELEYALHAEKYAHSGSNAAKFDAWLERDELVDKLKALEKQEPVAWIYHDNEGYAQVLESGKHPSFESKPLYAAPVVVSQDAEDAARYRWLRNHLYVDFYDALVSGKDIDIGIDAAVRSHGTVKNVSIRCWRMPRIFAALRI